MQLTKHHGLGNDFLVLVDPGAAGRFDAALAVALCDRRTGVGADGLLRAVPGGPGGAEVTMVLLNADGSRAEMSGNGIRCLVQAVVDAGLAGPGEVRVATDAGLRIVTDLGRPGEPTRSLRVDMGVAKVDGDEDRWPGQGIGRGLAVDVGNPHVVLEALDEGLDVATIGARLDAQADGGTNVELVRPGAAADVVDMEVFERGVGVTLACGTGACAAAVAAARWGWTGPRTTVRMPGGEVVVELGDDGGVLLTGPATFVARVEVPGI
ncbi:MAG: diaminopimelate epimerase [Acidimicrobiia bacterium]